MGLHHGNSPCRFDEEDELDIQGKGGMGGHGITRASPFQRDIRKSMFRDGAVFAQWMERVHEYGIQVGLSPAKITAGGRIRGQGRVISLVPRLPDFSYCKRRKAGGSLGRG